MRRVFCSLLACVGSLLTAADPLVFVSGNGPDIIGFTLADHGTLTEVSRVPGGKNPTFLALSPERKHLYAVNGAGADGKVLSFAIDLATGTLTPTGTGDMGAAGNGTHLSVHPSGKWIFTASYGSGHVAVLPVKADGSVGDAVDVQLAGKNAHQAVVNRDGSLLFVPTLGTDQVQVYHIDVTSGKLTLSTSIPLAAGAGPRHCALSPDEKHLYVINEYGNSVTTFRVTGQKFIDVSTHDHRGDRQVQLRVGPQFTDVGTVATLPVDFTAKNTCAHIVVSPDGKTVYGSNRGHDSVAIFRVSEDGGTLTLIAHETAGGVLTTPRNFTLTPDGTLMLVAAQRGDSITALRVDPATGLTTTIGTHAVPGSKPSFVGVVPR